MDSAQTQRGQERRRAASPFRESLPPDRYRVLHQVAAGGMGSVWLAADKVLGRRVAIKVLAEQFTAQPHFVKRFQREARTAAALSGHPHIVTIYDVGEHDGQPFIVMAYLPGGTVRDRMKSGHVERGDAVVWIRDTASALDFAHARAVVHRDVKPQNLLFDGEDRVVVADLGIARAAHEDSLTGTEELLGTACYISPEQATGEPATPASDRYSLAVVAYELLTGSRPFAGGSFAEQALQRIESEPERPSSRAPELSPEVDAVLLKGLAKDPSKRWESATAFAAALREALEEAFSRGRRVTLPRPTPPPPMEPTGGAFTRAPVTLSRRSPGRAGAILATFLGAVLLAAVVMISTGGNGGSGSSNPREHAGRSKPKEHRPARAGAPATTTTPTTAAPAIPAGASPASLNQQGFGLMNGGRYDEAVPLLKRAVAGFPKDSKDLTYAYALYNLGRSLRLAGKPSEAIPYLERRLGIDNQRGVVRRELAAARAAASG